MGYAERTQTSVSKSQVEIQSVLRRSGILNAMFGEIDGQAIVTFQREGRQYRLMLRLPEQDSRKFTHTPTGKLRIASAAFAEWEQACRSKWRELLLLIKAKLVAIENDAATFENEFLAYLMLPGWNHGW